MNTYIDLETYCTVPLKSGTYVYAQSAEIMLISYAFDDGPVHLWDRTRSTVMPVDLANAFGSYDLTGDTFTAHGAMFDRTALRYAMKDIPVENWRCTLAKALAHGLPGGLDRLGEILNIPMDQRKLKEGKKLVQLFCKPDKKGNRNTRFTHPQEWETFCEYAKQDIPSMRAVDHKLPKWNYEGKELALWHLDQRINDRGFLIDTDLCHSALATVDREKSRSRDRTVELSGGRLDSATQRDAFLDFIFAEHGVDLPDAKADTLERRLNDEELPATLRELIAIRLEVSGTSPSKYKTLLKAINADGRMRGTMQFCGAQRSGRWAGRGFQPHNLMRVPKYIAEQYDDVVDCIKQGAADLVYEKPIEACGSVVKAAIIAPKGTRLCIADLSNIEGRGAARLAGEEWKLEAFRALDAGTGHDLYKLAYATAFNVDPEDVDSYLRQIGKVMELFLQYQGGVGAFMTGAMTYGIDLDEMAAAVIPTLPDWAYLEAKKFLEWQRSDRAAAKAEEWRATRTGKLSTYGLPDDVFIACDALKRLWRVRHPMIEGLWGLLEDGARSAILQPGVTFSVRELKFRRDGAWLRIVLPSGRALCYAAPQLTGERQEISYMGVSPYTRRWQRIKTYGGKLLENVTQAYSRDLLAENMPNTEAHGYGIVLHVHDELVCEAPDSKEYCGEQLAELMTVVPDWAVGMPLDAKGFVTYRYRKG